MIIPDKLKIGACWWKIQEVDEAEIDCDEHVIGDQSFPNQLIRLSKTLTPEMKSLTLLHEILHCINGQLEHDMVEVLSNQLHQVILDNNLDFRECPAIEYTDSLGRGRVAR